ncbi:MAG: O-antigen ligase family protein [Nitrospiraceae bacterium]|nr:O-antigen ligase family protein [Nitrospiraceae bacterium]
MTPGGRERALRHALAASLVFWALCLPISKSATYIPLFASAVFGLGLRVSPGGKLRMPAGVVRLAAIWLLFALWQCITLLANGEAPSAAPFARALDYLPVFLLAGLACDRGWKERAALASLYVLTSLTAFIIVLGMVQAVTGIVYPLPVQPFTDGTLLGLFSHHIPAGGFFSTLAVISGCLFLFWKSSRRQKAFFGIMFLLLLSGSLLSMSRTYFVSLCITLPLIFFKKNVRTAAAGTAAMAVIIAASIVSLPPVKTRVASILDLRKNPSNVERLYLWRVARDMIETSPVAGIGYRHWGDRISQYTGKYASEWKFSDASFHHAHNVYLHVAAETGLVGLALFLAFWVSLLVLLLRASASAEDGSFTRALTSGSAFAIVNLFIGGLFENNFWTLLIVMLICFVAALALFVADGPSLRTEGHGKGSAS